MSKKIFNSIMTAVSIVFIATLILIVGVFYSYFLNIQDDQLMAELELAARGVELNGTDYLEILDADTYRITWITADGDVLFDSSADVTQMDNHLDRIEVRQALENGEGKSSRLSVTLSEQQIYVARKLEDGSVLRISMTRATILSLFLGFAQPIAVVILIGLGISLWLASRLSKKIVDPINLLDLDHPLEFADKEEYKEIAPLLVRISDQQMQLRADKEELEKTSRIRQEFTANVSHELKTPLHSISGYAELIENGLVKEKDIRPFAGRIREESNRLTNLVTDIIDLTRLDSVSADLPKEKTDLYRLAENAVDALQNTADEANVTLTLEGEKTIIDAAPKELYSLVFNLCDNAIKYNKKGGSVHVTVADDTDSALLTVEDTGLGIAKENQDRIFERFYRVDKSRAETVPGTGLGLSIVKHAALLHDAEITLSSTLGEGSAFCVRFPKA